MSHALFILQPCWVGSMNKARHGQHSLLNVTAFQYQTQIVGWYLSPQVSDPQPAWEVLEVLEVTHEEIPRRGSKINRSKFRVKPLAFCEATEMQVTTAVSIWFCVQQDNFLATNKLAYLNTNQVEQPFRQVSDLFYSVPKKDFVLGINSGVSEVWHTSRCLREFSQHPSDYRCKWFTGAAPFLGPMGRTPWIT